MSAIAREAGALLLQYFHQGLKIEYKGDADLVTAADRASEALIRERISKQFPSHDVLGEEQGLNDQGSDYPVVCGSAGRHYEFRARVSGVLRFYGGGTSPPVRSRNADRRSRLRSDAR